VRAPARSYRGGLDDERQGLHVASASATPQAPTPSVNGSALRMGARPSHRPIRKAVSIIAKPDTEAAVPALSGKGATMPA
jgi:hypothetical protein